MKTIDHDEWRVEVLHGAIAERDTEIKRLQKVILDSSGCFTKAQIEAILDATPAPAEGDD